MQPSKNGMCSTPDTTKKNTTSPTKSCLHYQPFSVSYFANEWFKKLKIIDWFCFFSSLFNSILMMFSISGASKDLLILRRKKLWNISGHVLKNCILVFVILRNFPKKYSVPSIFFCRYWTNEWTFESALQCQLKSKE